MLGLRPKPVPPERDISGFVALSNTSPKLDNFRHKLVREAARFHAEAGRRLDQLGHACQRLRTELARLTFQSVSGNDEGSSVLLAHRLFDLRDRLGAILLEITKDTDEARAEFGPALLEEAPIDDVPSLVGQIQAP